MLVGDQLLVKNYKFVCISLVLAKIVQKRLIAFGFEKPCLNFCALYGLLEYVPCLALVVTGKRKFFFVRKQVE